MVGKREMLHVCVRGLKIKMRVFGSESGLGFARMFSKNEKGFTKDHQIAHRTSHAAGYSRTERNSKATLYMARPQYFRASKF